MRRSGFTLIEMVIVLGVVGVTAGLAVPIYRDYQIRSDLNLATEQVKQGLERARLLAQAGTQDDAWGFYVPAGVIYKGSRYFPEEGGQRDTTYDEVYPMPSTIGVEGLLEVNFAPLTGEPGAMGQVQLVALNNERQTILIEVQRETVMVTTSDPIQICYEGQTYAIQESERANFPGYADGACPSDSVPASVAAASSPAPSSAASSEDGAETSSAAGVASSASSDGVSASSAAVVVVDDPGDDAEEEVSCGANQVVVCHVPPGNPSNRHTLCVGAPSLHAHLAHGDTAGPCATEIITPAPVRQCQEGFRVEEDGTLVLLADVDMVVRVIDSYTPYGEGGPNMAVTLRYSVDGGDRWKPLFGFRLRPTLYDGTNLPPYGALNPEDSTTVTGLPAGSRFLLLVKAYYKAISWLSYDKELVTNDHDPFGHALLLTRGMPLPSYASIMEPLGLGTLLQEHGMIAADGTLDIAPNEALLVAEHHLVSTSMPVDFRDVVALVQFVNPRCP